MPVQTQMRGSLHWQRKVGSTRGSFFYTAALIWSSVRFFFAGPYRRYMAQASWPDRNFSPAEHRKTLLDKMWQEEWTLSLVWARRTVLSKGASWQWMWWDYWWAQPSRVCPKCRGTWWVIWYAILSRSQFFLVLKSEGKCPCKSKLEVQGSMLNCEQVNCSHLLIVQNLLSTERTTNRWLYLRLVFLYSRSQHSKALCFGRESLSAAACQEITQISGSKTQIEWHAPSICRKYSILRVISLP